MNRSTKLFMIGFLILGGECLFRLSETDSSGDTLFNYFFFDERYRRRGLIEDGGIFARGYEIRVNNRGFREAKEWPPNDKKDQLVEKNVFEILLRNTRTSVSEVL